MKRYLFSLLSIFIISGCSTLDKRPDPLTFESSSKAVIEAMNALQERENNIPNDLVQSEVIVLFHSTGENNDSGTATIEIKPTGAINDIDSFNRGWTAKVTQATGNNLTTNFRSIFLAKKVEHLSTNKPGELIELSEKLKVLGWKVRFVEKT